VSSVRGTALRDPYTVLHVACLTRREAVGVTSPTEEREFGEVKMSSGALYRVATFRRTYCLHLECFWGDRFPPQPYYRGNIVT
jgi:hypothetical protein